MRDSLFRPRPEERWNGEMADTLLLFFDESGDHLMEKVDPDYPVFALGCVAISKEDYMKVVVPALAALKVRHWGHEGVVLHSIDIRRQVGDFGILRSGETREAFHLELGSLVRELPFHFAVSVVDKKTAKGGWGGNLYAAAWKSCVVQLRGQLAAADHHLLIAESRGRREDAELRTAAGLGEIIFATQRSNVVGLQLADLCAYPFGRKLVRPDRPSRAWDDLTEKANRGFGSWELIGK